MAVDLRRKFEGLPYLCLSTSSNLKIYELEAEREGCILKCSEIDMKLCPGIKNLTFQSLSFISRFIRVYNNLLRTAKHENRIVY